MASEQSPANLFCHSGKRFESTSCFLSFQSVADRGSAVGAASRYHYQRSQYHQCLTVRAMRQ